MSVWSSGRQIKAQVPAGSWALLQSSCLFPRCLKTWTPPWTPAGSSGPWTWSSAVRPGAAVGGAVWRSTGRLRAFAHCCTAANPVRTTSWRLCRSPSSTEQLSWLHWWQSSGWPCFLEGRKITKAGETISYCHKNANLKWLLLPFTATQ